ncbi:MAG: CoA pyrophosphatase [Chloroflexota bacterium]
MGQPAAVLVPLVYLPRPDTQPPTHAEQPDKEAVGAQRNLAEPGEWHIILMVRTDRGPHGGQVSFPGGRPEPGDRCLLDTALREAQEELGIDPATVRILDTLPVVETIVSNFSITPFVGVLDRRPGYRLQEEECVAVLEVPLSALRTPQEDWWDLPGGQRLVRWYPWQGQKIWGATFRIIQHLLAALERGLVLPTP